MTTDPAALAVPPEDVTSILARRQRLPNLPEGWESTWRVFIDGVETPVTRHLVAYLEKKRSAGNRTKFRTGRRHQLPVRRLVFHRVRWRRRRDGALRDHQRRIVGIHDHAIPLPHRSRR